ncbi:hypothetical protein [Streptomyces sp. NPDC096339]|uniref:hypothetical protein n=1 Tax=Streptomyces sp. NPDC096339 TaxID=3366086 RepID=UPI003823EF40
MSHVRKWAGAARIALIALLLALTTLMVAPAAFAEPTPTPTTSASPNPETTVTATPLKKGPPKPKDGGMLQPFNVVDRDGVPISAYTVKTDTGGWKDIDLKIWNIVAQLLFGVAKWVVGFTCWLIKWALDFGLAKVLVKPVDGISMTIKTQVIDRLGLPGLFLMFAGFYCGWLILFKERSRGFAEIGLSLVIAALTTTVLVSPAQVLLGQEGAGTQPTGSTMLLSEKGLLGKARCFSLEVSTTVLSKDPTDACVNPDAVSRPITDALVDAFIVRPNQLMVYGTTFDGKDDEACDKAFRQFKLAEFNLNSTGMNYWTAMQMDSIYDTNYIEALTSSSKKFESACASHDPKAKRASADLAFSALFIALAAVIVAILMILVTGGFLTAQGWLAFEAIRGHWALCAGILPGGGRATLWRWFSAITKALLSVALAILFLAMFILIILALIKADTGDVLAVKFIVIDVTALAGLAGHKRIKQTAGNIAENLNRKLASARVGGSGSSVFNNPSTGLHPNVKQMVGDARSEAGRVAKPVGKGLKLAHSALVGKPQADGKVGRLAKVARFATQAATAIGTGGASTAAQMAAKQAARQALKKRLASAATRTRAGRATIATGKVAAGTTKVGAKVGAKTAKGVWKATGGLPVSVPRGVARTKRVGAATAARTAKVGRRLAATQGQKGIKKIQENREYWAEYGRNVSTAKKFAATAGTKAQVGLGLAPIEPNPRVDAPPGPRAQAIGPEVPGAKPEVQPSVQPGLQVRSVGVKLPGAKAPSGSKAGAPASGPTAADRGTTPAPQPPAAAPSRSAKGQKPASPSSLTRPQAAPPTGSKKPKQP